MKWLAVLLVAFWTWGMLGCGGDDRDGDGVPRVVCLGDSNTDPNFQPDVPTWCERLQARHPEWEVINRGATYAVAQGCGILQACSLLAAALQLEPDVVLLAFGTNDLYGGATAEEVVAALLALTDQAEAGNATPVLALIPPVIGAVPDLAQRIEATNDQLIAAEGVDWVIDFYTGFVASDFYADGVHVNDSGQEKRADAAEEQLLRWH